jgi:hypothetical protein
VRARIERRAQDVGFRTFGLMRFSTVSFGNTSLAIAVRAPGGSRGTGRCYGAGGGDMATSSLHVTDGVPRCPSRTTAGKRRKGPNTSTELLPSGIYNLPG